MTFQIAETPLGWVVLVAGKQCGDLHASADLAIIAAMATMRFRGVPTVGRWLLEWDESYRWYPA